MARQPPELPQHDGSGDVPSPVFASCAEAAARPPSPGQECVGVVDALSVEAYTSSETGGSAWREE